MKKVGSLFVILFLVLSSLTACSQDSSRVDASPNKNAMSNVFQVGDMMLDDNGNEYYYGGIVDDSVVIQVILDAKFAYATSMSLYVPVYKNTVITLPKTSHQFVIENVDRHKGTITLKQIK